MNAFTLTCTVACLVVFVLGQDGSKDEADASNAKAVPLLSKDKKYSWLKTTMLEGLGETEVFVYHTTSKDDAAEIQNQQISFKKELVVKAEAELSFESNKNNEVLADFLNCPTNDLISLVEDCQAFFNQEMRDYVPELVDKDEFEFGYWSSDYCKNLVRKEAMIVLDERQYQKRRKEEIDMEGKCQYERSEMIKQSLKQWRAYKTQGRRNAAVEIQTVRNQLQLIDKELKNSVNAMEYLCMEYGMETSCGPFPAYNITTCDNFSVAFTGEYFEDKNPKKRVEEEPEENNEGMLIYVFVTYSFFGYFHQS